MRRILLIAQGTLARPLLDIASMAISVSIVLVLGIAILNAGWPTWVTIAALVGLLVGMALIKGRFGGPREFRVEKPADDDSLYLTGRFSNGEIPVGEGRRLVRLDIDEGKLVFQTDPEPDGEPFQVGPPAFSAESLVTLREEIDQLREASEEDTLERFRSGTARIKLYDAKRLVLLRYVQKPSYMAILWLVSGITMLVMLFVMSLISFQ